MSSQERKEKLSQTFEGILSDYERILGRMQPGGGEDLESIEEEGEED
jgi:hypothetical protein